MRAATRGLFRAFAQARSLGACPSSARRPPSVVTEWKFTSEMTSHLRCPISTRRPRRRRSPPEHRRPRTRRARCNSSRPPLHREILQHFAEGPRRRAPPAQHRHKDCPREGAVIVERFGKFHTVLNPESTSRAPSTRSRMWHLKEEAIHVANQTAVTKDNVAITIGALPTPGPGQGVVRRGEPDLRRLAARADHDAQRDWQDLLDKTFEERDHLNHYRQHDQRSRHRWGLECFVTTSATSSRPRASRWPWRCRPKGTSQEGDGAGVRG